MLAAAPAAVQAGRPLATEDAGLLQRGSCESESFVAHTSERTSEHTSPKVQTLSTQLGCGVGANSQLALAVARATAVGMHGHSLSLAGKAGLIDATPNTPALTLAWALTATQQAGRKLRHEQTTLNLVASHRFADPLTVHANLGWTRNRSAQTSSVTWNLAAEYSLGHGVDVMAERYGQQHGAPWVGAGLRLAVSERLFLDASYARQSGSARARLATLGVKLVF